jgi:nucleotide-binding universal stress UspA family protein
LHQRGEWYTLDRYEVTHLIALSQATDLVVLGQVNPKIGPIPAWCRPEEIVLKCGRPALMVPYIGSFRQIGERVLVGWDGSREAVRALHDALPVLTSAKIVTLMSVRSHSRESERDRAGTRRIVHHLTSHEVNARVDETLRGSNTVADVLLSRAVDLAADMIVAGAYHHSPFWAAIMGGVSRGLFHHMTVSVLTSH